MPAITKPNQHFDATLYNGNSSTQNITGVGFKPDLVWSKSRSTSGSPNALFDVLRGVGKMLQTDQTNAEYEPGFGDVTSFNSDGFGLTHNPSSNITNTTGRTYVAWQWKAGAATVTNTSGTISSQVSVNATAGFSIVTYTGTVFYPQTIGHGLGAVPQFIMVKNRSRTANWALYHASVGNTKASYINATDVPYADSGFWNNTSPTSTVFTGDNGVGYTTNGATDNYVAYCWTPIAGYSAFGSYTGNASTDGPFVYTGFKPKFLMIKRTDATNSWVIQDTTRSTYNVSQNNIYANSTGAEASYASELTDILSNGFKQRGTGVSMNASGGTYIYMAFAEAPFKYAGAR